MNLAEITIEELQHSYQQKKLTVKEVVEEYISRIRQYDEGENGLNSVLEINPEAALIAQELDQRGKQDGQLLYGVPVLIKDNIDTADRLHTSAGSLALAGSSAEEDAELVKRLREAGAVILGKTNMTEFANYMTEGMPNGYSSRGGQVLNPYNRKGDPSGSSSGSGVAVAANLCTASIGSDTCNSIVGPGTANGIVGFRPSIEAISQKGIIPISFTLDTAGPFTRTVKDAALMYAGLTGRDFVQAFSEEDIKGKVIGYNVWKSKEEEDLLPHTEQAIEELSKAGAIIKRISIPESPHIMEVMKYEFKFAMNRYLSTLPASYPIRTLADIIEFNKLHSKEALKYGQTLLTDAQENASGELVDAEYLEIMRDRQIRILEVREQLRDVDFCMMYSYNSIMMYTGFPVITIPYGLKEDGMPAVLQMTAMSNEVLLQHAYTVERLLGRRVEPRL